MGEVEQIESMHMNKLPNRIQNSWQRHEDGAYESARILDPEVHPEGLNVRRHRFVEDGVLDWTSGGMLLSFFRGRGWLTVSGHTNRLRVCPGVHVYVPSDRIASLEATAGTELVVVSGASPAQARGRELVIRDETFIAACATRKQALRWVLTPQYLSRRIFLHHDAVLLSKSGNPVSWFHTTMFDVTGLPPNDAGEPVFKMAYNTRTEFNVCYDVRGDARVRVAEPSTQQWGPWLALDGDSTYHVNESPVAGEQRGSGLRNKHEVAINGGHVTLFCLFDPAPLGMERHTPGEYSDYQPSTSVIETADYEEYVSACRRFDKMVDTLSLAKAEGRLDKLRRGADWERYLGGEAEQLNHERHIHEALVAEGLSREKILEPWMLQTREPPIDVARYVSTYRHQSSTPPPPM